MSIIVLFVLAVSLTGFGLFALTKANELERVGIQTVDSLSRRGHALFSEKHEVSELIRFRQDLLESPQVKGLILYDAEDKLIYAYARNSSFIDLPPRYDRKESISIEEVDLLPRSMEDKLIQRSFREAQTFGSKAIVEVLPFESLFKPMLALLLLLLFSGIFFLLALIAAQSRDRSPAPPDKVVQTFNTEKDCKEHVSPPDKVEDDDLLNKLGNELKRAANFDQDLVLGLISCGRGLSNSERASFFKLLEEHFEYKDLIFEQQDSQAAVVLPNTELEQGLSKFNSFQKMVFNTNTSCRFDIAIGSSSRNGRLIGGERLLGEAQAALRKAESAQDNRLVGFKPDPGKYRAFLAQEKS
ncbi:MAG TPA: hypothetical protein ENN41_07355 [Sediminispirochaeta sp.]|nr:hypothetical protein [Sediminispirochaeta sp.]